MSSRLLLALLNEAKSAQDKVHWSRTVCMAASQMARGGKLADAVAAIADVRSQFGPGLHPAVASWLMLAEGVLHFCQQDTKHAYDRIQRAHALAVAMGATDVVPTSAGWMAAIELNNAQYDKMIGHIREALTLSTESDHQARARGALLLGTAIHIAGDFQSARKWYDKARWHAAIEGDRATISALLFNPAIVRCAAIRLDDALERPSPHPADIAAMEASGSKAFDAMTGNSAQADWALLLEAQQSLLSRQFEQALLIFQRINTSQNLDKKTTPLVLIDIAWCKAMLGNVLEADATALQIEALVPTVPELDERVYILARLVRIARLAGNQDRANSLDVNLQAAVAEHETQQTQLLAKLKVLSYELQK